MGKRQTIAAIKALPFMTASYDSDWGEFRVTLTNVSEKRAEAVAYYTEDAEDALDTARAMSRTEGERKAKRLGKGKGPHAFTLYFLGSARPLYVQGDTYAEARLTLIQALADTDTGYRLTILRWLDEMEAQRERMPSTSATSCEHGSKGLSWANRPHDVEHCRRLAALVPEAFPGLDYGACVTAAGEA